MALTAAQAINQQTDTGIPGVVNRQTQLGDFGSLTGMTPAPAPRMTQPAAPPAPSLPMPQRAQQSIVQGQQEAAGIQAQQQAEAERNLSVQQRGLERIAQGEMGIKQDYAKAAGQALEVATPAEAPTFQPSRDDVTNLMGLFGLVTAVGFASAGEGRYSAINALSNMEGMMKGYNKGRADLFTQESTEFEKNLRKVAADNQALKDRLERSLQMFAVNRDAALAELEPIKADLKGSAIEYDIRQGYFKTALDRINKNIDNAQKVLDRWEESKQRFEERQILQGQMLEGRKELAAFAASLKQQGGGKPLSEANTLKIEGLDSLNRGLRQLEKDFDPKFAGLGVFGVGAELELEARRRLGDKDAARAVSWWARYNQLQAPNRHLLFGATLTGNELQNYRSFTAKVSDSADTIKNMLRDQLNYTEDAAQGRRDAFSAQGYFVAEPKPRDYFSTFGGASGTAPQGQRQEFATEDEARAANLPKGTKITIGGRNVTVQ
jgi:hypothetical protein